MSTSPSAHGSDNIEAVGSPFDELDGVLQRLDPTFWSEDFDAVSEAVRAIQASLTGPADGIPTGEARLEEMKTVMDAAVRNLVRQHHMAFNVNVHAFTEVADRFTAALQRVQHLRAAVHQAKALLRSRQYFLKDLAVRRARSAALVAALRKARWLKRAPQRIERALAEQRLLQAARLQGRAQGMMFQDDLLGV